MINRRAFAICLSLLIAVNAAVVFLARRGDPVVLATNLEHLPVEIDGMKGTDDTFPQSVYDELKADRHVYRHYAAPDGRQIELYIGYYGTAKGGRTPHNPYACMPAAGWGLTETNEVSIRSLTHPEGVQVNSIVARRGETYETVLHWYQSDRNRVLRSGIQQNIQRFLGRTLRNRNDGAFVRVSAYSDADGLAAARKTVDAFAVKLLDLLPQYWPEEK